jgi:hypothetical protein
MKSLISSGGVGVRDVGVSVTWAAKCRGILR